MYFVIPFFLRRILPFERKGRRRVLQEGLWVSELNLLTCMLCEASTGGLADVHAHVELVYNLTGKYRHQHVELLALGACRADLIWRPSSPVHVHVHVHAATCTYGIPINNYARNQAYCNYVYKRIPIRKMLWISSFWGLLQQLGPRKMEYIGRNTLL